MTSQYWYLLIIFSHSSGDFPGLWYNEWFSIEIWTWGSMLWDSGAHLKLLFYLAFPDTTLGGERVHTLELSGFDASLISPLSLSNPWVRLLGTAGHREECRPPLGLPWYRDTERWGFLVTTPTWAALILRCGFPLFDTFLYLLDTPFCFSTFFYLTVSVWLIFNDLSSVS